MIRFVVGLATMFMTSFAENHLQWLISMLASELPSYRCLPGRRDERSWHPPSGKESEHLSPLALSLQAIRAPQYHHEFRRRPDAPGERPPGSVPGNQKDPNGPISSARTQLRIDPKPAVLLGSSFRRQGWD